MARITPAAPTAIASWPTQLCAVPTITPSLEELGGALLEAPDQRHQPVLLDERRPSGGSLRDVGALRRSSRRPLVELEDVAVRVEG